MIDPELHRAFLETSYGPPDERMWLSPRRTTPPTWATGRWVILTAWNPQGQRQSAAANAAAQAQLRARAEAAGYALRDGVNGAGEWAEDALLIDGLPLRQALTWARDFDQAALLCGSGARVALVWHSGLCERFWAASHTNSD